MNIVVKHTISMGHRLQSYKGICSSLHGHNVTVEVHCKPEGFLDFKVVSEHLKEMLKDFDHAMVLEEDDPIAAALEPFRIRTVLLNAEPTTENIAAYILDLMVNYVPETYAVKVHETEKYSASVTRHDTYAHVRRVD